MKQGFDVRNRRRARTASQISQIGMKNVHYPAEE